MPFTSFFCPIALSGNIFCAFNTPSLSTYAKYIASLVPWEEEDLGGETGAGEGRDERVKGRIGDAVQRLREEVQWRIGGGVGEGRRWKTGEGRQYGRMGETAEGRMGGRTYLSQEYACHRVVCRPEGTGL
jgi:hypothetical protein